MLTLQMQSLPTGMNVSTGTRTLEADSLQTGSKDEQKWIAAAQRGDVNAFNHLVRSYQHQVYRTAYRILGDADAAADATQDAFVSAFKKIKSFRGGSFAAWLTAIITNNCLDQLRAKRRRRSASLDQLLEDPDHPAEHLLESHEESPHEFAERQELGATLQKGLDGLLPDQRVTLVLADIEGISYEEIARMTGANLGTVKSRLSRARAHLREFLLAQNDVLPAAYRFQAKSV